MLNNNSPIFLIIVSILSILILICIISIIECASVKFTFYRIKSKKVFNHIRLVYISDFHNKAFKNLNNLLDEIIRLNADYIFLGGDFVDFSSVSSIFNKYKFTNAVNFLKCLSNLYKNNTKNDYVNNKRIFFSFGNHELRLKNKLIKPYEYFCHILKSIDISILDNDYVELKNNICLTGLSLYDGYYGKHNVYQHVRSNDMSDLLPHLDKNKFNIIMFHKPDYALDLLNFGYDLVFSGHNHGGLIKFCGNKTFLSPDFKILPKFNYGKYDIDGKFCIVSNGLGEHFIKIRVNNKPEIVVLDIN